MIDIGKEFFEHFQIVPATDAYLLEQAYKLRYEVLCQEKGLASFAAEKYPDGRELDGYDHCSKHCLIYHNESDRYVGTVRLILGHDNDDLTAFPLIKYAHDHVDMEKIVKVSNSQIAEISRLIIIKEFRSRIRRYKFKGGTYEDYKRISKANRLVTHPIIGLLAAILKMSSENNIKYWFAGMEPSLNKRLSQLGLQLMPIGPLVKYHGLRRPYMGAVDDVVKSLYFSNKDIWDFVTEQGKLWSPPNVMDTQARQLR